MEWKSERNYYILCDRSITFFTLWPQLILETLRYKYSLLTKKKGIRKKEKLSNLGYKGLEDIQNPSSVTVGDQEFLALGYQVNCV